MSVSVLLLISSSPSVYANMLFHFQAFSVLSRVKDEDAKKREILSAFYYEVNKCYDGLDDKIRTLLLKNMGNVTEKMKNHQIRLGQKDYYLLVAGKCNEICFGSIYKL